MLEQYFVKPTTADRIRSSWIGESIETYVKWLATAGYRPSTVLKRITILFQFGEFAKSRGVNALKDLPTQIESFASEWRRTHGAYCRNRRDREKVFKEAANPVRQMLRQVLPGYAERVSRIKPDPFLRETPFFFRHLCEERGLAPATIIQHKHHLRRFEAYLHRIGLASVSELSPAIFSAHITEKSQALSKSSIVTLGSVLRVFARYLHRERLLKSDLSGTIELPRIYSMSRLPRFITWDEVRKVLQSVDRRTPVGKRDYGIFMLLVTYGLRIHEIAGLTLEDVDWERERLLIAERKNGRSTAYPLSTQVGGALIDYLKNGRPVSSSRHLFLRCLPPFQPLRAGSLSTRVTLYLLKAGISLGRLGAHTLRHTCVQRLVDGGFPLKVVGDYVGHRSAESTKIYTKTAIGTLRKVALTGEDIL